MSKYSLCLLLGIVGMFSAKAGESPVEGKWQGQAQLANGRILKVTVIVRADKSMVEQHRWYASRAAVKKDDPIAEEDRPGTYQQIDSVPFVGKSYRLVRGAKLKSGKPSVFAAEVKPPCYCVYPSPYKETLFLGESMANE